MKLLAGCDPIAGGWLASQPTLSRFDNGVGPRDMLRLSEVLPMRSSRAMSGARSGHESDLRGIPIDGDRSHPGTGKPWADDQQVRLRFWEPLLKRASIGHRPAYDTRHTYASMMSTVGENPCGRLIRATPTGDDPQGLRPRISGRWCASRSGTHGRLITRDPGKMQVFEKLKNCESSNLSGHTVIGAARLQAGPLDHDRHCVPGSGWL